MIFLPFSPGGIAAETKQALENMKSVLERYGSSLEHVVKVTIMLADIAERDAMKSTWDISQKISPRGAPLAPAASCWAPGWKSNVWRY